MRIYKTREFGKLASKYQLTDTMLSRCVSEIESGLYDADLGSNLYKKRISFSNRGKSSGLRTLLAFKSRSKTFFIYCFAKNERDNISPKEKQALKLMSKQLLQLTDSEIDQAIRAGALLAVEAEKNE
ncbi:MAG: type II toxin-antitoxin system RelE/ParE family toxin [Amphritea sp.]|nr:type II toxin-antitoxin system RelE/ParE family toxin [Amphritea sp.]